MLKYASLARSNNQSTLGNSVKLNYICQICFLSFLPTNLQMMNDQRPFICSERVCQHSVILQAQGTSGINKSDVKGVGVYLPHIQGCIFLQTFLQLGFTVSLSRNPIECMGIAHIHLVRPSSFVSQY